MRSRRARMRQPAVLGGRRRCCEGDCSPQLPSGRAAAARTVCGLGTIAAKGALSSVLFLALMKAEASQGAPYTHVHMHYGAHACRRVSRLTSATNAKSVSTCDTSNRGLVACNGEAASEHLCAGTHGCRRACAHVKRGRTVGAVRRCSCWRWFVRKAEQERPPWRSTSPSRDTAGGCGPY